MFSKKHSQVQGKKLIFLLVLHYAVSTELQAEKTVQLQLCLSPGGCSLGFFYIFSFKQKKKLVL